MAIDLNEMRQLAETPREIAVVTHASPRPGAAKVGDRFPVERYSKNKLLVYVRDGKKMRVFGIEQVDILPA